MLEKTKTQDGTIGKAFKLLDIVESFRAPVKFNDILENSPFPKPSTYRLLQNLVNQDMLSHNQDTGHYMLGSRLIRLAHSSWQHASLAPIAAPYLDALSDKTGETIHLAKLDHGQVLYLDKRNAKRPISMFSDAGKIAPAYCTGVGKAMLAFLPPAARDAMIAQQSFYPHTDHSLTRSDALSGELDRIKQSGVAFDREEHELNIICIAVPILSESHRVMGGISITSSTTRTSLELLGQYQHQLQQTAKEIGDHASAWMLPNMGG